MKTMPNQRARPNILWICTDQQRYDTIGALGNEHVHTPNLDRLVREGVAFTHASYGHVSQHRAHLLERQ
jgi:arylsulfatase A-like enzyme